MKLREAACTLLLALSLAFGALYLLSGCTAAQHENAAASLQAVADKMDAANKALKSDLANLVVETVSKAIPPAAPIVKPVQVGAEWITGGIALLAGALAEWQRRKAAAAKKERNAAFDRLPTPDRKAALLEAKGP